VGRKRIRSGNRKLFADFQGTAFQKAREQRASWMRSEAVFPRVQDYLSANDYKIKVENPSENPSITFMTASWMNFNDIFLHTLNKV